MCCPHPELPLLPAPILALHCIPWGIAVTWVEPQRRQPAMSQGLGKPGMQGGKPKLFCDDFNASLFPLPCPDLHLPSTTNPRQSPNARCRCLPFLGCPFPTTPWTCLPCAVCELCRARATGSFGWDPFFLPAACLPALSK